MESINRVIKQKCKFLGNTKESYDLYYPDYWLPTVDIKLFISNETVESTNVITLLEEMTPLLMYIFSCLRHDSYELGNEVRKINIKLLFSNALLNLQNSFELTSYNYNNAMIIIRENLYELGTTGYCLSFLEPFRIEITLERGELAREHGSTGFDGDFYDNNTDDDNTDDDNTGIISINEGNTFKEDKCVICLTNPSNILFCNCGHICVCEECSKTGESLENCPICKTKNTILRILQ